MNAQNWLINQIENNKNLVKTKKTKEKLINHINNVYSHNENNKTIVDRKQLTKIKNDLDKLFSLYYNLLQPKEQINNEKEILASKRNIPSYMILTKCKILYRLLLLDKYTLVSAKRNNEYFESVKTELNEYEINFFNKYWTNLDNWIDLNNKIENITKILNPSKKEKEAQKLKEIKGSVNEKIGETIKNISNRFRPIIKKNRLEFYNKEVEKYNKYFITKEQWLKEQKSRLLWNIGALDKNDNLKNNYKDILDKISEEDTNTIIIQWEYKMFDKLGGLLIDLDKDFDIVTSGNNLNNIFIRFNFEDGANFTISNNIIINNSKYNKHFYQFPIRFHAANLPNGNKIKTPSEYTIKNELNSYYSSK